MTRALILAALLPLAACASNTAQTTAQKINAHWPLITSTVGIALLADGANPVATEAATKAEAVLGPQIAACAAGTDPNCTTQIQGSLIAFLNDLPLGPKGKLELAVLNGVLVEVLPSLLSSPAPSGTVLVK